MLHTHTCRSIMLMFFDTGAKNLIWALTRENLSLGFREQQRHGSACTSTQSDQLLCYSLIGKYFIKYCYKQNFTILSSVCGIGDWFESCFLGNPEDRFCCITAHMLPLGSEPDPPATAAPISAAFAAAFPLGMVTLYPETIQNLTAVSMVHHRIYQLFYLNLDPYLTLTLGSRTHKMLPEYPLHHVTYAPTKFEVAKSNSLVGDALTRKYII